MATTTQEHKDHGQIKPVGAKRSEPPVLPVLLKGNGLTLNLPYDEALEKYGLWKVKITERCWVHGKILEPGDTAELTGDVVLQLVNWGKASVSDKRMAEEADVINKAALLGLPQKIREIAAFARPKKDQWAVRSKDSEPNE